MPYSSNNNEWQQSDRFNGPLEASYFDDFQAYRPSSPRKRPIPSGSSPNSWRSANASSSFNESSSFPSSAWTLNGLSSGSSSQNVLPPFAPLTQDDYAFLANIDPTLLAADLANITANYSIPIVSEPLGRSPPRKRPRADEEPEGSNHTSIDAFPDSKRRRLSTDDHQSLPSVHPPTYTNHNNVISNTLNDLYRPASPASTSMLTQTHYPNPQVFHDALAYSVPIPPAPPVLLPPVHVGATQPSANAYYRTTIDNTLWWNPNADLYAPLNLLPTPPVTIPPAYLSGDQFYSNAYPGSESAIDYKSGPNGNGKGGLYNAAGASQVEAFPLPYYTLPDAENGPLDWTTGLLRQEDFYNATSVASPVASSSVVIPLFLERQYHTNAVANNATQSSVADFRQHSGTTNPISTTGNVANATIPNAQMPSTSVAPSADPLVITYDIIEPASLPSSPSPTCSPRPKQTEKSDPAAYPDENLWSRKGNEYSCHYKGPDCPQGCKQKLTSAYPRNLTRHIRKHAKGEARMPDLSANERVAFNGLFPQGLLRVEARCKLPSAELHRCAFYRQHGRRWAVMTMERQENLERKHMDRYHDADQ